MAGQHPTALQLAPHALARNHAGAEAIPGAHAGNKPKVLVITGPTGVGKTEASLLLAERLNGEIISADSVQVYRGLDVGSDKLPVDQRRGAWHLSCSASCFSHSTACVATMCLTCVQKHACPPDSAHLLDLCLHI